MPAEPVTDYTPYVLQARQQRERRRREAAQRLERAWEVARQVAEFLRQKYQPTRVIAFGSLVHAELFHLGSDIDLAVEGIPWPDYLRAWNDVEDRFPEFKIDLLDIQLLSPSVRHNIEEYGREL